MVPTHVLHARTIRFRDQSGRVVQADAPLPPELHAILSALALIQEKDEGGKKEDEEVKEEDEEEEEGEQSGGGI